MDKLTKLLLASVIGFTIPSPYAQAQPLVEDEPVEEAAMTELTWYADFDEAMAAAKAQGKDLLVDFTGSDWCVWCHRLDGEVFSKEAFKQYAAENFITVALDFPQDPEIQAQVPNPERNDELQAEYGVRGFPTVLLMTPEGEVYGRTGYRPDGPEPYVEYLESVRMEGKAELKKAKALAEEFAEATDENRDAVYERVLIAFEGFSSDYMGKDHLADVVKAAYEFDADNAKGFKLRATKTLLDAGKADDEVIGACRELDPKNEEGLLEVAVVAEMGNIRSIDQLEGALTKINEIEALGIKDQEVAAELYTNAAYWCWSFLDKPDEARAWGLKLEKIKGDDAQAREFLDKLFEEVGREASAM